MLKLKKLFSVAILALAACLLASLFPAFAVEAHASYYDEESDKTIIETSYYFREIDVKIDVRKDKTFAITERLRVGFLYDDYNTGIIRDIQRQSDDAHDKREIGNGRKIRYADFRRICYDRRRARKSNAKFVQQREFPFDQNAEAR